MDAHGNFCYSTVATAPSPATSGTSLVVAGGTWPATPFNATVHAAGATEAQIASGAEIIRVTGNASGTFTIARASEGPNSARSILVGDVIKAGATAKTLTDIEVADAAAATASLRTLGTGATQAAAGNDSRLSDSRAPSGTAGGDLVGTYPNPTLVNRMSVGGPAFNGLAGWNYDPIHVGTQNVNAAGYCYLNKVWVPTAATLATVWVIVQVAGTGGTALANCFVGVFNSSGTRLGVSATQAAAWATAGVKSAALTVDSGQSLAIAAGSYIYVGILVGTQSSTPVQLGRIWAPLQLGANVNLAAADGFRQGYISGGGLSAMPTSFTVSAMVNGGDNAYWVGVEV
jgi:hypothetical protein